MSLIEPSGIWIIKPNSFSDRHFRNYTFNAQLNYNHIYLLNQLQRSFNVKALADVQSFLNIIVNMHLIKFPPSFLVKHFGNKTAKISNSAAEPAIFSGKTPFNQLQHYSVDIDCLKKKDQKHNFDMENEKVFNSAASELWKCLFQCLTKVQHRLRAFCLLKFILRTICLKTPNRVFMYTSVIRDLSRTSALL